MRVILVDDELASLNNLKYYLSKEEDIEIIGMYQDSLEAIKKIITDKPDAVFLDISMPEIDGLSCAAEILSHDEEMKIVFVTAYDDYAIKAFELSAIDYILKPIDPQRIKATIKRLSKFSVDQTTKEKFKKNQFIKEKAMKTNISKLPLWENDRIFLCDIEDISFIFSECGYVKINTCKGKTYTSKETLNYYEDRLNELSFFRCHKSFIVNTKKIAEIIPWFNSTFKLIMDGDSNSDITVSRSYMTSFKSLFGL
ncbi:LytR/AlgR family response regulator transcription factor [Clostridium cellulovorans]|uniref:Stage 0 sporulation protein A homolog n=1 Tax=Clostridium cellulovorans (strain ATCC 35296 / DSM 3052 / OCM 3 / 743B) TaxID=573061 RepID=D9ST96_CLOC7|nr:LytTR family transcriptional regulator DNA-binding domain-containing protein [Clostridium cellulovorans]ADL50712.1 two component transcriptional regulator, LytTR family [Clostridium cellulovorans 743B]